MIGKRIRKKHTLLNLREALSQVIQRELQTYNSNLNINYSMSNNVLNKLNIW